MKIRLGTLDDLEALLQLGMQFATETAHARWTHAKPEVIREKLYPILEGAGTAFVAELEDGSIVGMLVVVTMQSYFSGEIVSEELVWWVQPEHRTGRAGYKLVRAFEEWASVNGVDVLKLASPYGSGIATFLQHRGYTPVEVVCLKRRGPNGFLQLQHGQPGKQQPDADSARADDAPDHARERGADT
jgi:GNAT superfamily N-acetyltransferase